MKNILYIDCNNFNNNSILNSVDNNQVILLIKPLAIQHTNFRVVESGAASYTSDTLTLNDSGLIEFVMPASWYTTSGTRQIVLQASEGNSNQITVTVPSTLALSDDIIVKKVNNSYVINKVTAIPSGARLDALESRMDAVEDVASTANSTANTANSTANTANTKATNANNTLANIGTYSRETASSVSVATSTNKVVCSITLEAGTYILIGTISYTTNTTGVRWNYIGTGTSTGSNAQTNVSTRASNNTQTFVQNVQVVKPTANTTYNLVAWQNSGSSLTCAGHIVAIRIK